MNNYCVISPLLKNIKSRIYVCNIKGLRICIDVHNSFLWIFTSLFFIRSVDMTNSQENKSAPIDNIDHYVVILSTSETDDLVALKLSKEKYHECFKQGANWKNKENFIKFLLTKHPHLENQTLYLDVVLTASRKE